MAEKSPYDVIVDLPHAPRSMQRMKLTQMVSEQVEAREILKSLLFMHINGRLCDYGSECPTCGALWERAMKLLDGRGIGLPRVGLYHDPRPGIHAVKWLGPAEPKDAKIGDRWLNGAVEKVLTKDGWKEAS